MYHVTTDSPGVDHSFRTPLPREEFDVRSVTIRSLAPVAFAQPFADATMGPFTAYHFSALRITDASGDYGEAEFPTHYIWMLEAFFVPVLLQGGRQTYAQLFRKMYWQIRNEGVRGAPGLVLGHIDRVFYDLASRRRGLPLFRYLGGTCARVEFYGSGGGNNLSGAALEDELLGWEAEGCRTVKMKFGGEHTTVADDVARIARVREVLRPETHLAVDANQFMSLGRALAFVEALRDLDIAWVEEPIHSGALHDIETLCAASTVPIAFGESERSGMVFPSLVRAGVHNLQPIAGSLASVEEWLDVVDLATAHGRALTCGGVSWYNCQFAAAAPAPVLQEFLEPVLGPLRSLFSLHPRVSGGCFHLGEAPGIGVEVDWPRLEWEGSITAERTWE